MLEVLITVGRLLLAVLFVGGAVQKALSPQDAASLLVGAGLPSAFVWPALIFNALGGIFLILGVWLGPVALALAAYCMGTSFFHLIPDDPWQMSIYVKNWAIAGGLLILSAHSFQQKPAA